MDYITEMTALADGFRKKYQKTGRLEISDMVNLIDPKISYPVLLAPDSFKFTSQAYDKNSLTSAGGSTISGISYITKDYYSSNKSLIHDPNTRPDMDIRIHLDIVKTDGVAITWGFYGSGYNSSFTPKVGVVESETTLPKYYAITDNNPLQFKTTGSTIINLATSYAEIIVGGG